MIIQGIGTIRLGGGIMLQVTKRIHSLTRDDEVGGQPHPRQKVMTIAGPGGHVMRHPAKTGHPAKHGMARDLGMTCHPKHPAKSPEVRMDGMARLEAMRI
jgi:hypothetical protein